MKPSPLPSLDLTNDELLLALAGELRRLANGLVRNVRRNEVIPGLSELMAMRALQAMLAEALSSRLSVVSESEDPPEQSTASELTPGYL